MKTPYPFQLLGIDHLYTEKRAMLADEMGLGKSVQAIKAAAKAKARRVLVICQAIARTNWAHEVSMWEPQCTTHVLTKLKAELPFRQGPRSENHYVNYILIVSFEFAIANRERLSDDAYQWDVVIVDEAQQLGNPWSQRTAAILGANSICAHTDRLWLLTGTPISTHADQLWAMAYEAQVTSLNYTKFCAEYCTGYWDGRQFQVVGSKNEDKLYALLTAPRGPNNKPWMLRRLEEHVNLQLPPIRFTELHVEPIKLTQEQVAAEWPDYADEKVRLQQKLHYEEELVRLALGEPNLLDEDKIKVLEGLAGSVASLRRYTGLQKVPAVSDLLAQELGGDEYQKVVVFFEHRSVGEALFARLAPFGAHLLYGGLANTRRDAIISDFQSVPARRVILVQYQTGSTSINLQIAHNVVAVEVPWIGALLNQAFKRCHRIGQKHSVHVRFAMLANSYDSVIMNLLRRRAREIHHVLDGAPRELMENKVQRNMTELRRRLTG